MFDGWYIYIDDETVDNSPTNPIAISSPLMYDFSSISDYNARVMWDGLGEEQKDKLVTQNLT